MGEFNRRFTKEQFADELAKHLKSMPPGHLKAPKKLEEHASKKAEYYASALAALDEARKHLEEIKQANPDQAGSVDTAISKIEEGINAYGDAALNENSIWDVD